MSSSEPNLLPFLLVGAARDVSFLIDFLPSYLYPNGERNVVNWGVIGLSLGGDACWIALKDGAPTTLE